MSKAKLVQMPLAELVEDMDLYPRHAVDDANVQSLAMALEAGTELPPIVADEKSKVIIDGWHRARAHKRVFGPAASVTVELRPYKDRAGMIEDAVALNAAHGRRLDVMDQTRAVLMLEKAGVETERIAMLMHVPEERVIKLKIRVARADVVTRDTVPGTKKITLKQSVSHLRGEKLTDEQAEAHHMMPGVSFLMIIRQLVKALRTKMINLKDEKVVQELQELSKELHKAV